MTNTLTREKLYKDVWTIPIGQLAHRLGTTPAKLRDACKTMRVPLPPLGHWNAYKAGNSSTAEPLPPHDGPVEFRIGPEKRVTFPRPAAPAAKPAMAAQPRLVPLAVWAAMVFGEHAPHSNTLLRWAHEGRIQPQARKIARIWWVTPNAEYVED
jgi:hypothetical protein